MRRVAEFHQLGAGKIFAEKQAFLAGETFLTEETPVPVLILTENQDAAELLRQKN